MSEEKTVNDNPSNVNYIEYIKVAGTNYTIKDTGAPRDENVVHKVGDTMTGTLNTPKICSPEVQVSTSTSSYATGCKLVYANDAVKFVFN